MKSTDDMTPEDLAFDRQHIWHPYSSMIDPPPVYPVVAADGVRLTLSDGRGLIDGMASWWSVIHGYNHPRLNRAAHEQIDRFSHVMFGGLTHGPAIGLCRRLIEMTPELLDRVFLCDSGSVSVEVAVKMAIQYWHARGKPEKQKLATIRSGYHGDTLGAMSVCDPVTGMHQIFSGFLPQQLFAPAPQSRFDDPWDEADIEPLHALLKENHTKIAAFIHEPVVQGAGGMRVYSPRYVRGARELCDEYGVLMIADEVATGFGRTGRLFACEHAAVTPDILCLGKAMTGGYMTLAATLTRAEIAETISAGGSGCFMHGPTFMANPLACAIACASIDLLLESPWQARIQAMEARMKQELSACASMPAVADVRVLGGIGVVELKSPPDPAGLQKALVDRGVWVRPFGKLVYVMPPYVMGEADLDHLMRALVDVLKEL